MKTYYFMLAFLACYTFCAAQQEVFYGHANQHTANSQFWTSAGLKPTNDVEITLSRFGSTTCNTQTAFTVVPPPLNFSSDGVYQCSIGFSSISPGVKVVFKKNDDLIDGLSAFDVLLIIWHVNGFSLVNNMGQQMSPFLSPFMRLAADVDRNYLIEEQDADELRKLILGVIDESTWNNLYGDSWRFMPMGHIYTQSSGLYNAFYGVSPIGVSNDYPFSISLYPSVASNGTVVPGILGQFSFTALPANPQLPGQAESINYFNGSAFAIKVGDLNYSNKYALFKNEIVEDRDFFQLHSKTSRWTSVKWIDWSRR